MGYRSHGEAACNKDTVEAYKKGTVEAYRRDVTGACKSYPLAVCKTVRMAVCKTVRMAADKNFAGEECSRAARGGNSIAGNRSRAGRNDCLQRAPPTRHFPR